MRDYVVRRATGMLPSVVGCDCGGEYDADDTGHQYDGGRGKPARRLITPDWRRATNAAAEPDDDVIETRAAFPRAIIDAMPVAGRRFLSFPVTIGPGAA